MNERSPFIIVVGGGHYCKGAIIGVGFSPGAGWPARSAELPPNDCLVVLSVVVVVVVVFPRVSVTSHTSLCNWRPFRVAHAI